MLDLPRAVAGLKPASRTGAEEVILGRGSVGILAACVTIKKIQTDPLPHFELRSHDLRRWATVYHALRAFGAARGFGTVNRPFGTPCVHLVGASFPALRFAACRSKYNRASGAVKPKTKKEWRGLGVPYSPTTVRFRQRCWRANQEIGVPG